MLRIAGSAATRPGHKPLLAAFDEAHPHASRLAHDLACEPLGAAPRPKTPVVVGGIGAPDITMCTPAVIVFGSDEFRAAAQLRPACKAARKIRILAVAQRGQDIAAADLVAKEMRRRRHDSRIVGFCGYPVDAGEMKAADAAGLVTARAGHVVKAALKTPERA